MNVHVVTQAGTMFLYSHNEPETGVASWGTRRTIGAGGWNGDRTLAGPNGVIYRLDGPTGDLFRYRWNGTDWDHWNGQQSRDVGNGWSRYSQAAYRNHVTVDGRDRLYSVNAQGQLQVLAWTGDHATGAFAPAKILDTGWNQYNLIVATDDGVLYARTPDGGLFRFRWNAASERFTQYRTQVGWGWNTFNRIFSPGGDVLYGSRADNGGELLWYRYHEDTATWANSGKGKIIGSGWYGDLDVVAATDNCRLSGYPVPSRPAVPQRFDAPTTPVQGTDGLVTFFYVNSAGGLTAGKQRNAGDYEIIEYQVIADYHQFTGAPGVGVRADGRIEALANSHDDADYRGKVQTTANGSWGAVTDITAHHGWMAGDPTVVGEANGTLTIHAVDDSGALWRRAQLAPNDTYTAWRKLGGSGLTPDFTLVRNGTALDIVARFSDGVLRTARYSGSALGAWRTIGTDATGKPAAVAHANGDLQVFTRAADGTVRTQRETAGVFPGTWQTLGDLTAAGAPAAVLRAGGLVELAVRGADNLIHQSSQVAPAGGFGPWTVHYFEDAATDPTGLLLSTGSPIFTWRSPDGSIRTVFISTTTRQTDTASLAYTGQTARR
ncbi:tachylectin-related carbohydrate-binding protein [Saccharothrix texasensis]|uniref:tachylectin-related carbohydrate-binding protein n=1 Tax=Saccharothrix texasensis TaxID=103734 RepID=UPI0014776315|nr:tachylectin-related carbohydrate-binding protein [Saccharothrix texasensis]